MKAIMVMFDSLNRHLLPPYGCDWVHAPNFRRLAERTVTFDQSYVGSMPCMPARREIHSGRYNFLHRSWGPLEPFDDSMPEILKQNGVFSQLVSDHYHYWEEGGANYHTRYQGWEAVRGQEGDPALGDLHDPPFPRPNPDKSSDWHRQDWVNRWHLREEPDQPQPKTFSLGLEFLRRNHDCDRWFLHLETFDPHEPYFVPQRFKDLYDFDFAKFANFDWPSYASGSEREEYHAMREHFRFVNAALISMCDEYLGKVLDAMDQYGLWDDTMLIVNTDHGFLLGEHDWWGKCRMPFYNEIANTPLFIWDPRCRQAGQRRHSLVQTIDLAPTILDFFGLAPTPDMQGRPLAATIADDSPVHDGILFGVHGGQVNVTDGRHVYMRAAANPENTPLFQYTYMPCHMRHPFSVKEMHRLDSLAEPFSFTKGCRPMKIACAKRDGRIIADKSTENLLFDLANDPRQEHPLDDPASEQRMTKLLTRLMRASDAPEEQYLRLGLD